MLFNLARYPQSQKFILWGENSPEREGVGQATPGKPTGSGRKKRQFMALPLQKYMASTLNLMNSSKKLVYIVDDDPDDRQIILDAFLEHHTELDYVFIEDARELLTMLNQQQETEFPSLVILDLNMPGMMGLQALKEIRSNKRYSRIPMVVLTTSTLGTDRKKSYELGANCFLTKPSLFSELVSMTRSISNIYFHPQPSNLVSA